MFQIALILSAVVFSAVGDDPSPCHPIDQPMPDGCPEHVGSPCPVCYTNPMLDYSPGAHVPLSASALTRIRELYPLYVSNILSSSPPSSCADGTVYFGCGGLSLLFFKMGKLTGNTTYTSIAQQYLDASLALVPAQKSKDQSRGYVGFQWSYIGTIAIAAVFGPTARRDAYVAEIQAAVDAQTSTYDDFDSGRSGLLFAARFLAANLPASNSSRVGGPISDKSLQSLAAAIVSRGRAAGTPYLQWNNPNTRGMYLGTSHGAAGILHEVLQVPGYISGQGAPGDAAPADETAVFATLDHMVTQQFPSGNFPSQYYQPTEDVLVQWDHGAPGISSALFLAAQKRAAAGLDGSSYAASASLAQNCTWARGILTKGLMQCHGIMGNIYMMAYAHRATGDVQYLYRVNRYLEYVVGQHELSEPGVMRVSTPAMANWLLWAGSMPSALALWTDTLYAGARGYRMTGFDAEV
eukprot:TRINITY_DN21327_c0_g1_i1.p1 TRINITY_DN21327_c0_g1~~TRINITY_DN21327_c0_g1_i1.p1  ORF type:complete len:473 (+),score=58.35 TRINITY_DN21327_c0_g1_i1:27-1421(+)